MAVLSPTERLNQLIAQQPRPMASMLEAGQLRGPRPEEAESPARSFTQTLREVVESVNRLQLESAETSARFAAGQVENVHDAMIAMEKASVSFQFLVEVRNRLLEGYREVIRMQV